MDAAFAVGDGGLRRGDGDVALTGDSSTWSYPVMFPEPKVLTIEFKIPCYSSFIHLLQ